MKKCNILRKKHDRIINTENLLLVKLDNYQLNFKNVINDDETIALYGMKI